MKIGKLSSLEEIAVGIAGERLAKSGALSHYEDRRERKGWLVEGVHGISIARRNNWVQSGRLPYVTSAPFKRESASASSSSSSPVLPFSPFSSSPGLASAPAKRPARRGEKETRRRRLPDEVYEDAGRTGAGAEEGEGGQEEDAERDEEKRIERGRGRPWIWKKRGARAHCRNRGRRSGALLVSKPAVGDRGGRRKKPWKKNAEGTIFAVEEGRRDSEQEQRDGQHGTKVTREPRKTTSGVPRRARSHNCLGAQWRGCPVNRRRTTPPPPLVLTPLSFRLSHLFTTLASFSRNGRAARRVKVF